MMREIRPTFSIILPCLNEGAMLSMTIESIAQHAGNVSCEVVVVDDGSTDDSIDLLRANRQVAVRIFRGSQLGVARARNLGAQHAQGEKLVFMDAHCRVSPGWLEWFAEILDDPRVGMCGPSFTKLDTPYPSGCGMYWADYTLDPCWFETPEQTDSYEVPLTTGACQAFCRNTFNELGSYDAGFTRWGFEDVEMCLRTWLLGYSVVVHPAITVAHYFREARDNYDVDDVKITYNFLRMIYLHFSPTRIQRVREAVQANPHVAVAQEWLADSDVFDRRAWLYANRVRGDEWFFREVNGVI